MFAGRATIAIPPGETILEQLEYHGISRTAFAEKMNLCEDEADSLIDGNRILTPETAARLESVLGPPARFWLGLEALYREDVEKVKRENAQMRTWETIMSTPVNYRKISNESRAF